MIYSFTDYRAYLKEVLAERKGRRANYSLRAFARYLNCPPSYLSNVLSGKRHLSPERAKAVAASLHLSPIETDFFSLLVEFGRSRGRETKTSLARKIESFRFENVRSSWQSEEKLNLFNEWYYTPIIEMTGLDRYKSLDPRDVSKGLNIEVSEAEIAIERLVKAGALQRGSDGIYRKTYCHGSMDAPFGNDTAKRYHSQMLGQAIDHISFHPASSRHFHSATLVFDESQMDKVRKAAFEFVGQICQIAMPMQGSNQSSKSSVYQIGVQFFNLI